ELDRLFVDGNAESIYYTMDDSNIRYHDMYHSRSSRIKLLVENNEITQFIPIRAIEGKFSPLHFVTQEAEILSGFVWKPGDRPTSKEDLLARKREIGTETIAVDTTASPPGIDRAETLADTLGGLEATEDVLAVDDARTDTSRMGNEAGNAAR